MDRVLNVGVTWDVKLGFYSSLLWISTWNSCPVVFNHLSSMWKHYFWDPLIMFVSISFPMYQKLHVLFSFSLISYFFHLTCFFMINNVQWWCWIHVLSLELWFSALYQQVLLKMLWIAHSSSNSSWNASCTMSFEILKGLYLFWSNFFESWFKWT